MRDAYDSMVCLLAAGTRLPAATIDATCKAAGMGPGELARDLLKRIELPVLCDCGKRVRVTTTRHPASGGKLQYTKCPACKRRGKVCTTP